jgi:hypothetical protein
VYVLFSQCLDGLFTIRAYGASAHMLGRMGELIDDNARWDLAEQAASRWLSMRLAWIGERACQARVEPCEGEGATERCPQSAPRGPALCPPCPALRLLCPARADRACSREIQATISLHTCVAALSRARSDSARDSLGRMPPFPPTPARIACPPLSPLTRACACAQAVW